MLPPLPFEDRTWAKPVARWMIGIVLVAEVATILWLLHYGPLDTGEVLALLLTLLAVIPPNVHILRQTTRPTDLGNYSTPQPHTKTP
jgi:hypothetical protein